MSSLTMNVCPTLQRTGNLLCSCSVREHIPRVLFKIQFNQTSSTLTDLVPSRFYASHSQRTMPPGHLSRTDTTKECISRIEMLGLPESELSKPQLFNVPLGVIEQRLQYCVEAGLRSSADCVVQFHRLLGLPTNLLLKSDYTLEKTDVVKKIFSSIQFVGPYLSIDYNLSFRDVHFQILNHCMEYEYGYTLKNWQRFQEAPVVYAYRNMITVKENRCPWSWIRNHPSLVCYANPYNLSRLFQLERLYELPMSIRDMMKRDADIAFVPFEDLLASLFILKENNVCTHDLSKRTIGMDHLLVNPDYLARQFQKIDVLAHPDKNNLELLYKEKLITARGGRRGPNHLEKVIARQCNPQTILSSIMPEGSWQQKMKLWLDSGDFSLEFKPCRHKPFRNVFGSGNVCLEEDKDIFTYTIDQKKTALQLKKKKFKKLPEMLASELKIPLSQVKEELARIPSALSIETKQSYETLVFLQMEGFTTEEIAENLILLLYQREIVEETLEKHIFPDADLLSETYRGRRLHVCLYHILVKYDFNLSV